MSNQKRRKPLVQHDIDRALIRQSSKLKKDLQSRRGLCTPENEVKMMINQLVATKPPKLKTRNPNLKTTKSSPKIKIVAEYDKEPSVSNCFPKTADKAVAATSKDIDVFFLRKRTDSCVGDQVKEEMETSIEPQKVKMPTKQMNKDSVAVNKDRQLRQYRLNVKTPKQRITPVLGQAKPNKLTDNNKREMPNTRRRRFSVQNEIAGRQSSKLQNDQASHADPNSEIKMTIGVVTTKSAKPKSKVYANSSKHPSSLEIVTECESSTSMMMIGKQSPLRVDKDITASSSTIDLENRSTAVDVSSADQLKEPANPIIDSKKRKDPRRMNRERTPLRRDKHPHQHRIKVRSPKRRMAILDQGKPTDVMNNFSNKRTTGTIAIKWEEEFEVFIAENVACVETVEDEERPSTHSLDDMCRICHGGDGLTSELGRLISACSCRGTVGRVHVKCLERWLTESGKSRCELCGTRYATRRVHRYGVPRALVMWILSQNAKQLMVDSLGIMLMSPLAVLAAWLSGRTLAGLMTQESHVTPWPLASTFVLACMTLVCYYCWIVSAATRHALGWWIWYRSQYEVRLQLQENEE